MTTMMMMCWILLNIALRDYLWLLIAFGIVAVDSTGIVSVMIHQGRLLMFQELGFVGEKIFLTISVRKGSD